MPFWNNAGLQLSSVGLYSGETNFGDAHAFNSTASNLNVDNNVDSIDNIIANHTYADDKNLITLERAIQVLKTGDFQEQWEVAKQISVLGKDAIAPLIALTQDLTLAQESRWFAIRALGDFQTPETITTLTHLITTETDEDLTHLAAEMLAAMGATAIAAISPLLDQPQYQQIALQSLSQIRQRAAIEPLLKTVNQAVNEADATIRYLAIESLSSFHDARITDVLLAALQDGDRRIRKEAITTLGRRADLKESHQLIAKLQVALADPDPDISGCAIIAIGRLGGAEAVTALQPILTQEPGSEPLKIQAVRALGWIQTEGAIATLSAALADSIEEAPATTTLQTEIIQVLGRTTDPALKPLASEALLQQLPSTRLQTLPTRSKTALALSLGNLSLDNLDNDAARDRLTQLLRDADDRVRLHAQAALAQIAHPLTKPQVHL